jgi:hypothetical protein
MPTDKNPIGPDTTFSSVFRVEKVDDNCCTFRVLIPEGPDEDGCFNYIATNSFFTLNLSCCCAIKCLDDTFVECLC